MHAIDDLLIIKFCFLQYKGIRLSLQPRIFLGESFLYSLYSHWHGLRTLIQSKFVNCPSCSFLIIVIFSSTDKIFISTVNMCKFNNVFIMTLFINKNNNYVLNFIRQKSVCDWVWIFLGSCYCYLICLCLPWEARGRRLRSATAGPDASVFISLSAQMVLHKLKNSSIKEKRGKFRGLCLFMY